MTLEEAESVQDFINIYKQKFGIEPPNMDGKGSADKKIDKIIVAVTNNVPIVQLNIPEGAKL